MQYKASVDGANLPVWLDDSVTWDRLCHSVVIPERRKEDDYDHKALFYQKPIKEKEKKMYEPITRTFKERILTTLSSYDEWVPLDFLVDSVNEERNKDEGELTKNSVYSCVRTLITSGLACENPDENKQYKLTLEGMSRATGKNFPSMRSRVQKIMKKYDDWVSIDDIIHEINTIEHFPKEPLVTRERVSAGIHGLVRLGIVKVHPSNTGKFKLTPLPEPIGPSPLTPAGIQPTPKSVVVAEENVVENFVEDLTTSELIELFKELSEKMFDKLKMFDDMERAMKFWVNEAQGINRVGGTRVK